MPKIKIIQWNIHKYWPQKSIQYDTITYGNLVDYFVQNLTQTRSDDQINQQTLNLIFTSDGQPAVGSVEFINAGPVDGNTITLNGLLYTARDSPVDPGDFLIGGTTAATAINFRDVMNEDTRIGTLGDVWGYINININVDHVIIESSLIGDAGNPTTLTKNGDNITIIAFGSGDVNAGTYSATVYGKSISIPKNTTQFTIVKNFFTNIKFGSNPNKIIAVPLSDDETSRKYLILYFNDNTLAGGDDPGTLYFGSTKTPEPDPITMFPIHSQEATNQTLTAFVPRQDIQSSPKTWIYDYFSLANGMDQTP